MVAEAAFHPQAKVEMEVVEEVEEVAVVAQMYCLPSHYCYCCYSLRSQVRLEEEEAEEVSPSAMKKIAEAAVAEADAFRSDDGQKALVVRYVAAAEKA